MRLFFSLLAVIIALSSPVSSAKDLKAYGADCEKIGFKPKTPAYGKCILELSRENANSTPQQKVEQPNNIAKTTNSYVRTKTLNTAGEVVNHYDTTSRLDGIGNLIWSKNNSTAASTDGNGNYTDAVNACVAMNTSKALGYSTGWRLPTQQELTGLYNTGTGELEAHGWALLNTWSSTVEGDGSHYFVYLNYGDVFWNNDSGFSYVTCVHTEKTEPELLDTTRYITHGGLTWLPVGSLLPWSEANSLCKSTTFNGMTNWRLPTIEELKSLYKSYPRASMVQLPWAVQDTWSSSGTFGFYYYINLDTGGVHESPAKSINYVVCVQ